MAVFEVVFSLPEIQGTAGGTPGQKMSLAAVWPGLETKPQMLTGLGKPMMHFWSAAEARDSKRNGSVRRVIG